MRRPFLGFPDSSKRNRPRRLLQAGRSDDQQFKPAHLLFIRCRRRDLLGGKPNPITIRYSNQSSNWSKYSKPWDVIFDSRGWGFYSLAVCDVPSNLPEHPEQAPGVTIYTFRPVHDPVNNNYPHTEIQAFKGVARVNNPKPSDLVKKEYRTAIRERARLLLKPSL